MRAGALRNARLLGRVWRPKIRWNLCKGCDGSSRMHAHDGMFLPSLFFPRPTLTEPNSFHSPCDGNSNDLQLTFTSPDYRNTSSSPYAEPAAARKHAKCSEANAAPVILLPLAILGVRWSFRGSGGTDGGGVDALNPIHDSVNAGVAVFHPHLPRHALQLRNNVVSGELGGLL